MLGSNNDLSLGHNTRTQSKGEAINEGTVKNGSFLVVNNTDFWLLRMGKRRI